MKKDREEIKNTMQMIGKRIRFHRRAADITQEELALGISCSASYISNLESGHARINVLRLIQIAEFLKVDAGELLSGVKYSLQGTTQGRYLTGGVPPVRFSM